MTFDWAVGHYVEVWQTIHNNFVIKIDDNDLSCTISELYEFNEQCEFFHISSDHMVNVKLYGNLIWYGGLNNPSELKMKLPWNFI